MIILPKLKSNLMAKYYFRHCPYRMVIALASFLLLFSCNQRRLFYDKPEITIYQTSKQADFLPAFAVLDLQSDSQSTRQFIETSNWLKTGKASDSITLNLENYLQNGEKNSLFKKLTPNVNRRFVQGEPKPLYRNSSFLGFCAPCDTVAVNQMLNDSGLLLKGSHVTWGKCDNDLVKNGLGLAVIPPGAKCMKLDAKDVEIVRVEQQPARHSWNWLERLAGRDQYCVTVLLHADVAERVRNAFDRDTAVMIKCKFGNKEVFCSTVPGQIAEGFTVLSGLKE